MKHWRDTTKLAEGIYIFYNKTKPPKQRDKTQNIFKKDANGEHVLMACPGVKLALL